MSRRQLSAILAFFVLLTLQSALAQTAAPAEFGGLAKWKAAVTSADFASLQQLYAAGARSIGQNGQPQDISAETQFWQEFLAKKHQDVQVLVRGTKEQNGLEAANLTISFKTSTPDGPRTRYVLVQQAWQQQGNDWRIVAAMHTDVLKMPQPSYAQSESVSQRRQREGRDQRCGRARQPRTQASDLGIRRKLVLRLPRSRFCPA